MSNQLSAINHELFLIESHAHLDYPDFAPDFDDVLSRATEAGVTRIITIGTSVESSRRAVEFAEKYPNVFAVIGVHPTYTHEAGEDIVTPLRERPLWCVAAGLLAGSLLGTAIDLPLMPLGAALLVAGLILLLPWPMPQLQRCCRLGLSPRIGRRGPAPERARGAVTARRST